MIVQATFIKAISTSADDRAIATAVIAMADTMKLSVTAEGVETAGQMDFLQQEKCNEAQGFYFSRPMATQDAERFLYEYGTMKAASA